VAGMSRRAEGWRAVAVHSEVLQHWTQLPTFWAACWWPAATVERLAVVVQMCGTKGYYNSNGVI
jgi:hypothetical protein